jgi:hypothetical protein
VPQNRLEELLLGGARSPAERPAFYRALLDSEVLVLPLDPPGGEGVRVLDRPLAVRLRSWEKDGRPVVAAYTSPLRVTEHLGAGTAFLGMAGRTLLETLGRGGETALVLNRGSAYGKEFTPEELAGLLDGSLLRPATDFTVQKGTRARIGAPAEVPAHLTDALTKLFGTKPEVRAAFLVMIQFDDEAPHLAVGVEVDPRRLAPDGGSTLLQESAFVARSALGDAARTIDLKILGEHELDRIIRERMIPFYVS